MDAQKEQMDLAVNPLPVEPATAEDTVLPTSIFALDITISQVEEYLSRLVDQRQQYLDRAVALNIMQDENYEIKKIEKNLPRVINTCLFAEKYPKQAQEAFQMEVEKKREAAQKILDSLDDPIEKIPLKTAEQVLSKRELDDVCYPHEVKIIYDVVKKKTPIKKDSA